MVTWTREEDKLFETALVKFEDENDPDRWLKIAGEVPGKTPEDIRVHYEALVYDVMMIESGRIEVPDYKDNYAVPVQDVRVQMPSGPSGYLRSCGGGAKRPVERKSERKRPHFERKRGRPWTADEHRLFLRGLEKYGKGDWRSISRNVVITRTPTQVASHAQKYFLRQTTNKTDKKQKRNSIHDVTIESPPPEVGPSTQPAPQVPFIDPSQVGSQGSCISPIQTGLQVPFVVNPNLNPNPILDPNQNLNPDPNWLQDYVVDPNLAVIYGNPDFGFPM